MTEKKHVLYFVSGKGWRCTCRQRFWSYYAAQVHAFETHGQMEYGNVGSPS